MIQGSDEWHAARLGKLTASRLSDALAKTKTGWGASRANLRADLVVERMTGQPASAFTNDAMRWGTETEPHARAAYEFQHDVSVELVGFVDHPRIAMSGASPDGLIGVDGLLEIKCPNSATHIDTLLNRSIPEKYRLQMHWQMIVTGRAWCDFVSFDPRLPEELRLYVERVHADEKRHAELEREAELFLSEVEDTMQALKRLAA